MNFNTEIKSYKKKLRNSKKAIVFKKMIQNKNIISNLLRNKFAKKIGMKKKKQNLLF